MAKSLIYCKMFTLCASNKYLIPYTSIGKKKLKSTPLHVGVNFKLNNSLSLKNRTNRYKNTFMYKRKMSSVDDSQAKLIALLRLFFVVIYSTIFYNNCITFHFEF